MKKVNITSKTIWVWDCPECRQENREEAYSVADLGLVCNKCGEEFEEGNILEDI